MERNISEILSFLTQSQVDDYDTWLKVGMALHADGQPCSVWDEWSKNSHKYQEGACEKHWKTFGNYSGANVGIGSIIQMAKDNGYKPSDGFSWNDPIGRSNECENASKAPNLELKEYLRALFRPGDTVNFVVSSFEKDGKFLPSGKGVNKSFEELIKACDIYEDIGYIFGDWNPKAGAWARINPMSGEGCKNSDVEEFRHCLIESDSLPKEEQLRKIRELNLPCSALVDSGGKSIHAIVKIDAGKDEKLYRERVSKLHEFLAKNGFSVDKACKNASRLSRIAAVTRDGKRQRLIAVNIGGKSYEEWAKNAGKRKYNVKLGKDIRATDPDDKSDNLVGDRFLTMNGSWLIVAQSGIGKSVLAMQLALNFCVGRSTLRLRPSKKMKVLFIQAENNAIDIARPFHSVIRSENFTHEENERIDYYFIELDEQSATGTVFVELLDELCEEYKPDLVIVDPLLSYIGCDISRQDMCATFLRNTLNPIITKHNIGLIFIHHTGKPSKESKDVNHALSYLGIGSSELTNWARAVSVIRENAEDPNVFEFIHAKRASLSGTGAFTYMKHSETAVLWELCEKPLKKVKSEKVSRSKYTYLELETMPPKKHDKDPNKSEVIAYIQGQLAKFGDPADTESAVKVYEAVRKNNPLIVFRKPYWHGRLYIPEVDLSEEKGADND